MPNLTDKRCQYNRDLESLVAKHGAGVPPDQATTTDDLEAYTRRWEAQLQARLDEFQRGLGLLAPEAAEEAPAPTPVITQPPAPLPRPAKPYFRDGQAALHNWLADLDAMMLGDLRLKQLPIPPGFRSPVQMVANDQEMRAVLAHYLAPAQATGWECASAHDLCALHLPGQGTYLNLEGYQRLHQIEQFNQAALKSRAELIGKVAQQRWGWGFQMEYTGLGQQAGSRGLWPALTAQQLGLRHPDTQAAALAGALHQTWLMAEAGWQDWVWQYAMFKARHAVGLRVFDQPRPGRWMELLSRVISLFPMYIMPFGVKMRAMNLLDLVKFLFLEQGDVAPTLFNTFSLWLKKHNQAQEAELGRRLETPAVRFWGRLFFSFLESNVGILSMPYAMLIICHADHGDELNLLALPDAAGLERLAASNPRAHPDTRLAMLSRIEPTIKYDPRAMFVAAWERFKLNGPHGIFD